MNKEFQVHRNKCHSCFKFTGRFILDCYCILCQNCFSRRDRSVEECAICHQKSKHNFIDVQDRSNVSKMSYLFSNLQFSFNRCIEAYKFQAGIDTKYCKFLENQLCRYKDAISEIVMFNPEFAAYFEAKLVSKPKQPYRSVSQHIPNDLPPKHSKHPEKYAPNTPRSMSNASVIMHHERIVDPQKVGGKDRNYSGKVNYKMPNINYNTALRNSNRPQQRTEDEGQYYHQRYRR